MTPLNQQLEDKKKELTEWEEDSYFPELTKELNIITIKKEIVILEQAIAEIDVLCSKLFEKDLLLQKQRQEILEEIISIIRSKEKHGVIILDAEVVDKEFISKHLNPTPEQIKELEKEDLEIKLKSARISNRNELCDEIIKELEQLNQPKTEQ